MTLGLIHRRPGELPAEITGFVGRNAELTELSALLQSARLVTVTGPGGVGKTRLALRAAATAAPGYGDGVCLIDLSGLRDPELLSHTVATSLGLPERDVRSQLDALLEYLRGRHLLLILDTCEHLLDACAMLTDVILQTAAGITVLATSRQPLDVPGEHTCLVAPLPVEAPGTRDAPGDAAALFAQRAAAVVPGFTITDANRDDVIRLCRRLDGIPLAIELATVRLRALPLGQLVERLEDRFRVLTGGRRTALPRHQTLATAIGWSYDLCTPAERTLWARLSVFAESFDVRAAEVVCGFGALDSRDVLEALIGLVDKSVVLRVDSGDGTRYRLLDTIRAFGAEQLAAAREQDAVRARHLDRYLTMAGDFYVRMTDDDQLARFRALSHEHADIRAALDYALTTPGLGHEAALLARSLFPYWEIAGRQREGKRWQTRLLEQFPDPSPERAWAFVIRGFLGTFRGERDQAVADLEAGIPMAAELGDAEAIARGQLGLTIALTFLGRHEDALAMGARAEQSLGAAGDRAGLISLDSQLGLLHLLTGDTDRAIDRCASGLRRLGEGSGERWLQSWLRLVLAFASLLRGEMDTAFTMAVTAMRMKQELGDVVGVAYCLEGAAWHAALGMRNERAAWLLGAADAQWGLCGARLSGDPALEVYHQAAADAASTALGQDRYQALWQLGERYPLDRLIDQAASGADELEPDQAPPVTAPRPDPLTGREREIATLVTEGLSNREIAERLVISKRTVDAHVEHIYGKLGISSRVQLASWLRPDGAAS
jgi:predicted ATPase/DNA-binding CsgD family transcriptional regulator